MKLFFRKSQILLFLGSIALIILSIGLFMGVTVRDSVAKNIVVETLATANDNNIVINYGNSTAEQSIYVFSSLDCSYCVRFHDEVPYLVKRGIKVIYIPLSISPRMSDTYQKMAAIWNLPGAERAAALDRAFADTDAFNLVSRKDKSLRLGQSLADQLSINVTPTIIFPDGSIHRGYASSRQILRYLQSLS